MKIELNRDGVRQLLTGPEIEADLAARAERIAAAAGDGFEASTTIGRTRARASVISTTAAAIVAEANDHVLTTAIDAGR